MNEKLSVQNLRVAYGRGEVLRDVNFALAQGETAALLGLNASGKTTLLRAVCGLIPLRGGSCRIDGGRYLHLDERHRAKLISYLPQRPSRLDNLSVMDVVLMGFNPHISFFASPGKSERAASLQALDRLGMKSLAEKDFSLLSEGQKQLVLLARALVQDTGLLLLDEPDSALDYTNRHLVLSLLRNLVKQGSRSALITLHDPNFALAYCDRLLILKDGVIARDQALSTCGAQELRSCLSLVFGQVDVIVSQGRFIMVGGLSSAGTPISAEVSG